MKEVKFNEYAKDVVEQIGKGAFLNTKYHDKKNTMTIGWGNMGIIWGKPVFTVAVRYSRHTYELIDKAGEFSISVPLSGNLKKELGFCGSKSGRDFDKFKECGFTEVKGQKTNTPLIGECDIHYECKVVYKQAMEPALIDKSIDDKFYTNNDFHVLYYGEIVGCYETSK